ncbi:MAG: tetratricopeptide repeat protein, partial [Acetobacteraceae bacterium]
MSDQAGKGGKGRINLGPLSEAGRLMEGVTPLARAVGAGLATPAPVPVSRAGAKQALPLLQAFARLRDAGRPLESIAPMLQAIRLDPDNAAAHLDLGFAYRSLGQYQAALASLRRGVALQPDFARGHFHLGIVLEELGDSRGAVRAYHRAVTLAPKLVEARARMGTLLITLGRHEQAKENLQAVAEIASGTTIGRLGRIKALMVEERNEEAEQWARRTVALEPRNAQARRMLASLLTLRGQFDDAIGHLLAAIESDPRDAGAYLALTRARKMTEADRGMIARMEDLLKDPIPDSYRMPMHFALGKAFDDLKEYEAAWRHFTLGNQIRGRSSHYDHATAAMATDRIIAWCPRGMVEGCEALGEADETPIFILGMPRSGTTLVEQIISSHPDVRAGDELRFWPEAGDAWVAARGGALPASEIRRLAGEYRAVLRKIGPESARVTDKNPFNFIWIG